VFGFNGKEQDKETSSTTTYDYGFRIYSPALGRFLSIDPLAKKFPELTPYQYASNTPIQAIDLDGLEQYHFSLQFNNQGQPLIKKTHETHFKYEHWKMTTVRVMGFDMPWPQKYWNEDHRWEVHTGLIHEGNVPDNSRTYQMEITRTFDNEKEMNDWVKGLKPSDLKRFDKNYAILDQIGHHLNNIQEIYQEGRPGKAPVLREDLISAILKGQKQSRQHTLGGDQSKGKGTMNSLEDAQEVLDAYQSGKGKVIDADVKNNKVLFQYDGMTGNNNNKGTKQNSSTFILKGKTEGAVVVPTNPGKKKL
jgi:RHS repeat-associated protein